MRALLIFQISESQSIQILIDEQNKTNLYGYVSEGLHVFDEVEVRYIHDDHVTVVTKDCAGEIISVFSASLEKSLKNKLGLDKSLVVGKVSYFFSKKTYMSNEQSEEKDDIFPHYWVWSSLVNLQTWLYNLDNKIYLEISPTYPWLFLDPQKDELYVSFDEYTNSYKPLVLVELHKERVQTWINQCYALLQTMEKVE